LSKVGFRSPFSGMDTRTMLGPDLAVARWPQFVASPSTHEFPERVTLPGGSG
jgi:hypothetical protein